MRIRSLSHMVCTLMLGLVGLVLLSSAQAAPQLAPPPGYTVDWGAVQVVPNPALRSVYPSVVLDSAQKMHIVYVVENANSTWDLLYTNNVNGTFAPPSIAQANVGNERTPFFKLAIDSDNKLHLVFSWYGKDKLVYYRQGTLGSGGVSWSQPQLISDGNVKAIDPYVVIDRAGNAHFIWADQRCGWPIYNAYYRVRRPDGSLSPTIALRPDCGTMERSGRLALTNDGKVHAVFMYGDDLYYARLEGGRWLNRNISESPGTNTYNPTLATDGTGLYVAWDDAVNGHDIRFRRSIDSGENWSNIVSLSNTPDFASYPMATYSATRKRVYIAWGDSNGQAYMQSRIWYREFDPASGVTSAARLVEAQPGPAMWPALFAGRRQLALDWQDRSSGVWRALAETGSLCEAALAQAPAAEGAPDINISRIQQERETIVYLPVIANQDSNGC